MGYKWIKPQDCDDPCMAIWLLKEDGSNIEAESFTEGNLDADTLLIKGCPDGGEIRITLFLMDGSEYMQESTTAVKTSESLMELLSDYDKFSSEWINNMRNRLNEICDRYDKEL